MAEHTSELEQTAAAVLAAAEGAMEAVIATAGELTQGGKASGDSSGWEQPFTERVVEMAAAVRAARCSLDYARAVIGAGESAGPVMEAAALYAGSVAADVHKGVLCDLGGRFGGSDAASRLNEARPAIQRLCDATARVRLGQVVLDDLQGRDVTWLPDDSLRQIRDTAREVVKRHVTPEIAHAIHHGDLDIPAETLAGIVDAGLLGIAIPEEFGGFGLGNRAMLVATETLSAASLGAAGSLPTRPEILTNALLRGGTEEQKSEWLPKIAAGEVLVAIAMTEPNAGSDVASVSCRATRGQQDGVDGWFVTGAKAWCTFAGRANVISLLARTEDTPGGDGLSMLIVPKDSFPGHEFVMRQPSGGTLQGKADRTIGYRGMHSFTMQFENYFVPAGNLIGGEGGRGNGMRYQLAGMNGGRLQTAGRATGVAQRALELAAAYALERKQFGRPIAEYGLTRAHIGTMAAQIQACRSFAHAAAERLDTVEKPSKRDGLMPAMAKFLACDVANQITERAQWLHGGWGYAEEYPISRLVIDAKVLPLFEGVRAILVLKAIAPVLFSS
ncbi:MAG: acyl-CoA dehydrogenase [Deltaproteobacteria bacterium]|nr:acyl-CoA dehydrogenase [Deltaproteobacteria bacterium]